MSDQMGDQAEAAARAAANLGMRIRARREEVGLSQSELAQLAGVHRGTIRNVEMGKPMEARTAANVKRVLGCSPNINYATRNGPEVLRPVLSPRATAILAGAILRSDKADQPGHVADFLDLVTALSEHPPNLPATLHRFWDAMTALVPPADLQLADREIREFVSAGVRGAGQVAGRLVDVPAALATSRRQLPNATVGAVVQAGLPPEIQEYVLDALAQRYDELRQQAEDRFQAEAEHLLSGTKLFMGFADIGSRDDQVQDMLRSKLPVLVRTMLLGVTGQPNPTSDRPT